VDEISQFVTQEAQALVEYVCALLGDREFPSVGKFRHGVGNGIVEAAVEGLELDRLERYGVFKRHLRDGLTQIAVVVHHLVHRKSMVQKLETVLRRRGADLRRSRLPPIRRSGYPAAFQRLG